MGASKIEYDWDWISYFIIVKLQFEIIFILSALIKFISRNQENGHYEILEQSVHNILFHKIYFCNISLNFFIK